MKAPDLKSTLFAVALGAVAAVLLDYAENASSPPAALTANQAALYGGVVGAAVQIGARLLGVS